MLRKNIDVCRRKGITCVVCRKTIRNKGLEQLSSTLELDKNSPTDKMLGQSGRGPDPHYAPMARTCARKCRRQKSCTRTEDSLLPPERCVLRGYLDC